ncbi:MAG: class I SAM-dependent methyltransferase, partial [Myxococcota bacterium]|nr:class I SAM-dependent methyltransferase [Myxococcota bacterium]
MDVVRKHYNRFPYPPVPRVALPRAGSAPGIAWETGRGFAGDAEARHKGIRILVAGAGTLEALVVAQQHPRAAQVVAVDLSASSLELLRHRTLLARLASLTLGLGLFRRVAPLKTVEADLATWEDPEGFDYIVATNVLHHHAQPLMLLARLAGMLRDGGVLRLTTYPRASRFWPRAIGRWLRLGGITADTPDLVQAAIQRAAELPSDHPIRLAFADNPESRHAASLSDAYLHPVELPQHPLEWGRAVGALGLRLVGEGQHPLSQSAALHELCPATARLSPWEKLQILDDVMELGSNPVLWLHKTGEGAETPLPDVPRPEVGGTGAPPGEGLVLTPGLELSRVAPGTSLWLPSDLHVEMARGLLRADAL